jgi:hypothetical protein
MPESEKRARACRAVRTVRSRGTPIHRALLRTDASQKGNSSCRWAHATVLLPPPARRGDGCRVMGGDCWGRRWPPAALEEGGGGTEARRWRRLVAGRWWSTVGIPGERQERLQAPATGAPGEAAGAVEGGGGGGGSGGGGWRQNWERRQRMASASTIGSISIAESDR